MLLKGREVSFNECEQLYRIMRDAKVFPYVREKSETFSGFLFNTKKLIEMESRKEVITRTILNEYGKAIGCISLFDIQKNEGFLATWLGADYHGRGYNQRAKEVFFDHVFFTENIDNVFMKIRKENSRSINAARKLPYTLCANEARSDIYSEINKEGEIFDLYYVSKLNYFRYKQQAQAEEAIMA